LNTRRGKRVREEYFGGQECVGMKKIVFFAMGRKEKEAFFGEATKAAIAGAHAGGRYTAHGDEKGVYRLYPDGHKEYLDARDEKNRA